MQQFVFKKKCIELIPFPHIIEFALKKNTTIQFNSLKVVPVKFLGLYYVIEGKFEWLIEQQNHTLYPGDLAIVLPGQQFGGEKDFLDIGTVMWLHIQMDQLTGVKRKVQESWSGLSVNESRAIGKIFTFNTMPVVSKSKETGALFQRVQQELFNQEIGYHTRVNQLIDEILILIARHLTGQSNYRRDFPQTFMQLEGSLRKNLAHHWTVEEMAALTGLGTTAFSEKVKAYTGFSPLNYLINIRISEALKLLKRPDVNVTDIALDVGFYSSQHFATTFKKLTGYTPSEFRKKNITNH